MSNMSDHEEFVKCIIIASEGGDFRDLFFFLHLIHDTVVNGDSYERNKFK